MFQSNLIPPQSLYKKTHRGKSGVPEFMVGRECIVHVPLGISYKNYVSNEINSTKVLGMHIDSHMNWKNHIEQISHKLSVACFTIRNLTYTLNTDILVWYTAHTFNQFFNTE